jgi:hypothetical protein
LVIVSEIYNALGDEKSLKLFRAISTSGHSSGDLLNRLKLSHKEYYSRMSGFLKIGIVKRRNGKYYLTAFGNVVYQADKTICSAVDALWKLKAVDSIDLTEGITTHERKKLLDSLVDDMNIKEILSKTLFPNDKVSS